MHIKPPHWILAGTASDFFADVLHENDNQHSLDVCIKVWMQLYMYIYMQYTIIGVTYRFNI